MNPIRVVVAADYIAPSGGAFIKSISELSKNIKNQDGNVAFLFSKERPYLDELKNWGGLFICPKTANRRFSLTSLWNMQRAIRLIRANVVHIHFVGMAYIFSACLLKPIFNYKLVTHWRNPPISLLPGSKFIHRFSPIFYRFLNRYFIDKNVVISDSIKKLLVDKKYAPASHIEVIYNGIDIAKFNTPRERAQQIIEERIKRKISNRPVVGMVANFSPQKDHEMVIRACAIIKPEVPDVLFLFIGSEKAFVGEGLIKKMQELIESLNLQDNVIIMGECQNVYEIIPRFDVGVLCSNFEGFGNAIVEYMLAGKPVIGTETGGIVEIIQDGKNGFLVPQNNPVKLAEKLLLILKNKSLATEMGIKARLHAERNFSLNVWVSKILNLYNSL